MDKRLAMKILCRLSDELIQERTVVLSVQYTVESKDKKIPLLWWIELFANSSRLGVAILLFDRCPSSFSEKETETHGVVGEHCTKKYNIAYRFFKSIAKNL